ncbi:hypothetical protein [Reinekea marinisedimentorum]|nr:hypothetical protein [Reinekea marinisedimentorum]
MHIQIGLPCTAEPWCDIAAWAILIIAVVLIAGLIVAVIREVRANRK